MVAIHSAWAALDRATVGRSAIGRVPTRDDVRAASDVASARMPVSVHLGRAGAVAASASAGTSDGLA
jgi:hypothetical protein